MIKMGMFLYDLKRKKKIVLTLRSISDREPKTKNQKQRTLTRCFLVRMCSHLQGVLLLECVLYQGTARSAKDIFSQGLSSRV